MDLEEKYREFNSPEKRLAYFRHFVVHVREGMLFRGGFDPSIAVELEQSFEIGNFIACILLSQLLIEHSLAHMFLFTDSESVTRKGFSELINKALEVRAIPESMAKELHELRLMRNPYVHPRYGNNNGTLVRRAIEKGITYDILPVADGIEAIQIVGRFVNNSTNLTLW